MHATTRSKAGLHDSEIAVDTNSISTDGTYLIYRDICSIAGIRWPMSAASMYGIYLGITFMCVVVVGGWCQGIRWWRSIEIIWLNLPDMQQRHSESDREAITNSTLVALVILEPFSYDRNSRMPSVNQVSWRGDSTAWWSSKCRHHSIAGIYSIPIAFLVLSIFTSNTASTAVLILFHIFCFLMSGSWSPMIKTSYLWNRCYETWWR